MNFKAVNARKAAEASASASAKAAKASVESPTRTKNYGKVPAYLKERQAEMQAEVERKCALRCHVCWVVCGCVGVWTALSSKLQFVSRWARRICAYFTKPVLA